MSPPSNPTARQTRIYTDQALSTGQSIVLSPDAAKHLIKVLRRQVGDEVVLFNGDGLNYSGELTEISSKAHCEIQLKEAEPSAVESPIGVHLIQAIARGERMDWVIQKAVELGVREITPVFSERVGVKLDPARATQRQKRWQTIVLSACEQSGRATIPQVHAPMALTDWRPRPEGSAFFLDPQASNRLIDQAQPSTCELVVGPEGGLSPAECEDLSRQGLTGIRLGARVLRTETAGVAALAAIQTLWGDF